MLIGYAFGAIQSSALSPSILTLGVLALMTNSASSSSLMELSILILGSNDKLAFDRGKRVQQKVFRRRFASFGPSD